MFDAVYDTTLTAFSILQTLCCPESLPSFRSFQNFYKQLFTVLGKQRLLCGPICSLWLGTPKNCLRSVQCHMIIFLLSITRNYLCIIKFCEKKIYVYVFVNKYWMQILRVKMISRTVYFHVFTETLNQINMIMVIFQQCIVSEELETAASYLIILQNLERPIISRQVS